jgi:hypothetical protein
LPQSVTKFSRPLPPQGTVDAEPPPAIAPVSYFRYGAPRTLAVPGPGPGPQQAANRG